MTNMMYYNRDILLPFVGAAATRDAEVAKIKATIPVTFILNE